MSNPIRDSIDNWAGLSPVRKWQAALMSEHGPHATTRHILLTLSVRMTRNGDKAYPGVRELERRTGLSQRTIINRLDRADEEGWVRRVAVARRRAKCRQYLPAIPGESLKEVQRLEARLIREGAEALSATGSLKLSQQQVAEDLSRGAESLSRVAEGNSAQSLKEVQQSSSGSSSESISKRRGQEGSHEDREPVPDDWKPPGELGDSATLYAALTDDELRWAGQVLRTEASIEGLPDGYQPSRDYELGWLPAPRLRELQYRVATRNGDGS